MGNYIAANSFCVHHQITYSFLEELHEHGLIEITVEEQGPCINEEVLPLLEKMVRLHYDLDINVEGIETITHLLSQMERMQQKILQLENELSVYHRP